MGEFHFPSWGSLPGGTRIERFLWGFLRCGSFLDTVQQTDCLETLQITGGGVYPSILNEIILLGRGFVFDWLRSHKGREREV